MDQNELDLAILKELLTNKKHAIDFIHEASDKIFAPEYWFFAKQALEYIKLYKDIPTKKILLDRLNKKKDDPQFINIDTTWEKVQLITADTKEFQHNVEALKNRYAINSLHELQEKLVKYQSATDIKKAVNDIQGTNQTIKSLYMTKKFDQKTLKEALPDFRSKYNAKKNNPEFGQGIFTGYHWFDFITNGIRPSEMLLVGAESGGGKCHAKGQGILKYDGSIIKVENIKIGDLLMGPTGPKTVLKTNIGNDYMYDIVPVKGKSWRVNIDHILTVHMLTTNEVIDISVKDYLQWNKTKQSKAKLIRAEANFQDLKQSQDIFLDPYLLGLLLGDGNFTHNTVNITTADTEIVKYVKQQCKEYCLRLYKIKNKYNGKAKTYGLSGTKGCTNPIMQLIEYYKLKGKNSHTKYIPPQYKTANKNVRLEILAGLMDTDGSNDGHGCFDYISASEQLANDVVFIARSVGLAAYVHKTKKRCQNNFEGEYYRVCISGHINIIPCKIKRKQAAPRRQIKNVLHTGFKIVPTNKKENYYGFTLSGDGRYLLDDFTITHNSMFLMNMAIQMWMQQNTIEKTSNYKKGYNVLFFSLEMPHEDCLERTLARLAMVPQKGLRDSSLVQEDLNTMAKAAKFIENYPYEFDIVDIPRGATVEGLELLFNEAQSKYTPDIVVVDYLGLMDYESNVELDDWLKLGKISEKLHEFGRVHNVVVLSAVQLTDIKRSNKGPDMQIGMHRVGRSSLIFHNCNFGLQIEKRQNEEIYPDMLIHMIKSRRTELARGRMNKHFACCALLDSIDTVQENIEDISKKMIEISK